MVETKLLAYHDDPAIKAKYMAIVEGHRLADEIVQGYGYWEDGKGCAVGCTLHGDRHQDYPAELGIPEVLAWLEDTIFEGLPMVEARRWPGRFLAAPEPGADLSLVWPRFAVWMLSSDDLGLPKNAKPAGKLAIAQVVALHLRTINGDNPSPLEWSAASSAAWCAGSSADDPFGCSASGLAFISATELAACSPPELAAWSAASPTVWRVTSSAEWSAASSAEWSSSKTASRLAAYVKMADRLIALMAEAPIVAH